MKPLFHGIGIALLLATFSSCNNGSSSGNSGPPANESTQVVMSAVQSGVNSANQNGRKMREFRVASDDPRSTQSINLTFPCKNGGSITVTGTLTDSSTGTNPVIDTFNYTYSFAFNSCVTTGNSGSQYQIAGSGLTITGNSTWSIPSGSGTTTITDQHTVTGEVSVSGAESLDCSISLTTQGSISLTNSSVSGSVTYNGSVCGQAENGTVTISGT